MFKFATWTQNPSKATDIGSIGDGYIARLRRMWLWTVQIAHQMQPTPRQSKNKEAEVITTILALEKTLDAHKTSVHELEMQLYVGTITNVIEFNLQLAKARS
ncbi:hypothetical protein BDR04DRAFT_1151488 [Suillus decipiens]|nr:hypothetical protein BDR04DRAFT_1151488 [Suillus decipiens]